MKRPLSQNRPGAARAAWRAGVLVLAGLLAACAASGTRPAADDIEAPASPVLSGGAPISWAGPNADWMGLPEAVAVGDPFVAAVAKVRPSVVAVGSYERKDTPSVRYAGTGFVVASGNLAVTNAHVIEAVRGVDRLPQLRVFFPDISPVDGRKASVVAEDSFHDLALLQFDGPPAPAVELAQGEPAQGQTIGILGYPIGMVLGLVPAAHKGVVSAVVPAVLPLPKGAKLTPELVEAIKRPYNLYQLDLVVFPGNSGSPVFEERGGRVIGIINKTLASRTREHLLDQPTAVAYAVPVRWAREALAKSGVNPAAPASGAGGPATRSNP